MLLALILGSIVGLSLGLTGGGGGIFALPLLMFGLGVPAREAVGVSLLTVGATSLIGLFQRAWRGMVEFPTGLLFAMTGMIGAPVGSWLADRIPEGIVLGLFALLMVVIAVRMWTKASDPAAQLPVLTDDNVGPTCRRDPEGKLRLTSQCAMLLGVVGFGAGILTGLFGVGGGFIIVPALVTFSGMGMQRAIGTSLLVITLIGVSGIAAHLVAGKPLSISMAAWFATGSIAGLFAGTALSHRLRGATLQRVFAAAIVLVAIYVFIRTFMK